MVTREDANTFYVKSSDPEKEPYFVYRSEKEHMGWFCDCMWYQIHERPSPPSPDCKHIKMCKEFK